MSTQVSQLLMNQQIAKQAENNQTKLDAMKAELSLLISLVRQVVATTSEMSDTGIISQGEFERNMITMVGVLEGMETLFAQTNSAQGQNQIEMAKVQIQALKDQENNQIQNLQKQEAAEARAKTESFFMKLFQSVMIVIGVVLAVATAGAGAIAVALIMATIMTLQMSGVVDLLGDLSNAIAKALEKDGMSPQSAQILAMVLTITIVIVATMGLSAGADMAQAAATASKEGAQEAMEEGIEMTTFNGGSESSSQGTSNAARSGINKAQIAKGAIKQGVIQGFQSMATVSVTDNGMNLNLAQAILKAAMKGKDTGTDDAIATAILDLVAIIGMLAGGAMSTGASDPGLFKQIGSKINGLFGPNATEILTNAAKGVSYTARAGSSLAGIAFGATTLTQANLQKAFGMIQAALIQIENAKNVNKLEQEKLSSNFDAEMKAFSEMNSNFNKFPQQDAIARTIASF